MVLRKSVSLLDDQSYPSTRWSSYLSIYGRGNKGSAILPEANSKLTYLHGLTKVQQPSSTWLSKLFGTKSKKPEEFIKKSSENAVVIECHCLLTFQVVRGNSIILLEALDRVV